MLRTSIRVQNLMPQNMPAIERNINQLLRYIGQQSVTSAQRSIQKKPRPAAPGRPPRDVTGKLKAGIDFTVRGGVLYFGVRPANLKPPRGRRTPMRRNVPAWLEDRHPHLGPAITRTLNRLRTYISTYSLTRK